MSLLEAAIGVLAPPQCLACGEEGFALCSSCSATIILPFGERCWRCNKISPGSKTCQACRRTGSPSSVWITTDYDGLTRDLLSLYKFGHQRMAVEPIARLMASTFLNFANKDGGSDYLIVPVPTATARIRERGFGHAELLSKKVALKLRLEQSNALRRLSQTRQLGSKREERLVQLGNSFAVKNPKRIKGRNILLVDDVVTTGGTIIAATRALRSAGAGRVDALLFAKRL